MTIDLLPIFNFAFRLIKKKIMHFYNHKNHIIIQIFYFFTLLINIFYYYFFYFAKKMTHMCLKDNRIKRMKSLVIRNEQKKIT